MKILVINAGSSSIKYQLIDMDDESVIAKGQAERIGIEGSNVKQSSAKGESCSMRRSRTTPRPWSTSSRP